MHSIRILYLLIYARLHVWCCWCIEMHEIRYSLRLQSVTMECQNDWKYILTKIFFSFYISTRKVPYSSWATPYGTNHYKMNTITNASVSEFEYQMTSRPTLTNEYLSLLLLPNTCKKVPENSSSPEYLLSTSTPLFQLNWYTQCGYNL